MTKRSNGDTVTMTISSFPVYPCALFYYNGEIQIEKFKKRKKKGKEGDDDEKDEDEEEESEESEDEKDDEEEKEDTVGFSLF